MIEITNFTKIFNKNKNTQVIAVDNANFTVQDGEILGLLGANGAGKTTILRIISTILKPTSGTVLIDKHDVLRAPDKVRKTIGFLTGETKLYDRLTVCETFRYVGRLYDIDEEELEKRINELVVMFELSDVKDRQISDLSDGMRQKVSLGRTIVHTPKNLVLDESLTGLDILARRAVANFIKEAKERDRCIIFFYSCNE